MSAMRACVLGLLAACWGAGCTAMEPTGEEARRAVFEAERAFAATMADRDLEAFASHLDPEAVFLGGEGTALVGRGQVVEAWSRFFEGPQAPFSWAPEQVEVLASGTLALSTGPVRDPAGDVIARFTTIWRWRDGAGWRVVFDRGCPVCAAGR